MSQLINLSNQLAGALNLGADGQAMLDTLKATVFKTKDGPVPDEQMAALLIVANQYGLNPWTKEIYAFPDKQNGIVPVVGVDGWARIINENPNFDGMEFVFSENLVEPKGGQPCPEWIECAIYRKDRSRPTVVREYLDETYREPFKGKYGEISGPWQSHTKRMLRHKAMIQAARLAFGFGGIHDEDEAHNILASQEKYMGPVGHEPVHREAKSTKEIANQLPTYSDEEFNSKLAEWSGIVEAGTATPERIISQARTRVQLTDAQVERIKGLSSVGA